MGFLWLFKNRKVIPKLYSDRIDELGDFLHTKIPKIPVLAISKVFSGGWNIGNKRSTMFKKNPLVCIHPCEENGGQTNRFDTRSSTKCAKQSWILVVFWSRRRKGFFGHGWWLDDVGERDYIRFLTWLSSHFTMIDATRVYICTLKS